ncbi:MAG TPA: hypothetical protein VF765_38430 [Polyangiaceae bacterium]
MRRSLVVFLAVTATGAVGCVDILGLDHGTPESSDGSVEASDPDGPSAALDASDERTSATDAAASVSQQDSGARDDAGRDAAEDRSWDTGVASDATGGASDATDAHATPDACAYTACPSGCWDTVTDPLHCGSCTEACPYGANSQATCSSSSCGLTCLGGALDCDHQASNGCECTPVANGAINCTSSGVCGHVCDQGYVDCAGHPCSCGAGNVCLSNGTCGACRASLQPCQVGSDCCSGTCGATLTCL